MRASALGRAHGAGAYEGPCRAALFHPAPRHHPRLLQRLPAEEHRHHLCPQSRGESRGLGLHSSTRHRQCRLRKPPPTAARTQITCLGLDGGGGRASHTARRRLRLLQLVAAEDGHLPARLREPLRLHLLPQHRDQVGRVLLRAP